jgi:hypothetical protein
MTAKTLLIIAILTASPGWAAARCGAGDHEQQVMSCTQGSIWDSATQTCTPVVSG